MVLLTLSSSFPSDFSAILQVAHEIYKTDEKMNVQPSVSALTNQDDLWQAILAMRRKTEKRKSVEPSLKDTPRIWNDQMKHDALASLLDGAVSHKNLDQRTIYIERIMGLPSSTQRSLMALIERRKDKGRTPGKGKKEHSCSKKSKTETPCKSATPSKGIMSSPASDARVPFSPHISNTMTSPNGTRRSSPGKVLFNTPLTGGGPSPRRSFEEAFGHNQHTAESRCSSSKRHASQPRTMFSPGLGDSDEIAKQIQELRERNHQLETELEKSQKRESDLTEKVEQVESNMRKEMVTIEANARRREDETREAYEEKIASLQSSLESLTERYGAAERAKEELDGVKDEMELMLHTKGMLAETTERLRKYKERLQQLTDVKDALQREEEAHSKSVEECLRLENEVKALQNVKKQLEEYKTRAVDAEVRFAESQDEVGKLKQEKQRLENNLQELVKGSEVQQEEVEESQRRIQQDNNDMEEALGVGEGLSELNPELKEEVYRLRNENERLRVFAAKHEDGAVEKMEQALEDSTLLCERYKNQFLSTKGELESTQSSLNESNIRETRLKNDLSEWTNKAKVSQEQANALSAQLHQCSDDLVASRNRVSELEKEVEELEAHVEASEEHATALSDRLSKCTSDLEASQKRELSLKQDVSDWIQQSKASQERANSLSEQLHKQSTDLKASLERESSLKRDVSEWTKQAKASQERANDLSEQLHICSTELNESKDREADLERELTITRDKILCMTEDLDKCNEELDSNQKELERAEQQLHELRNDLADMTGRAEDSEAISKQRMELVQTTRDKLTSCQKELDTLKETEEKMRLESASMTEKLNEVTEQNQNLEGELAEARMMSEDLHQNLERSEAESASLRTSKETLESELISLAEKVTSAESLAETLQDELMRTQESLKMTQISLKKSQDDEKVLKLNLENSDKRSSELEISLDRALKSRQDAIFESKRQLETTRADLIAKAAKDIGELKSKFAARLEEEVVLANKHKEEAFHTKELLCKAQASLDESQKGETLLKMEVTRLQQSNADLVKELDQARELTAEKIQECELSIVANQEALEEKAKKDLNQLQDNMNKLLEDERRAKRQADEMMKEELQRQQEKFKSEISQLQQQASIEAETVKKECADKIALQKIELEEQKDLIEKKCKDEKDNLVAKGKAMLNDVRLKAKEEIEILENEFAELKDKFATVRSEKEEIARSYTAKVTEYKKQLRYATTRINTLTNESDELEESVQRLEREKFKLNEENDRYRRQLGGRFGSGNKVENQLEVLQQEFKKALDEIRELKRKLNEQESIAASLPPIDENEESADSSYSRDAVNQSTLVQLRAEYEATLEVLNDEKRELIMKNSAAITDVQKAEKRAWESDQANASLKQELTSLKLQNERLQHELASTKDAISEHTSSQDRSLRAIKESATSDSLDEMAIEELSHAQHESSIIKYREVHHDENSAPENTESCETSLVVYSPASANRSIGVLSPGEARLNEQNESLPAAKSPGRKSTPDVCPFGGRSPGKDGQPECKQS